MQLIVSENKSTPGKVEFKLILNLSPWEMIRSHISTSSMCEKIRTLNLSQRTDSLIKKANGSYKPAADLSAAARSVRSHGRSRSSRPK